MRSPLDNNPKVQYLPLNTEGKDYVIGDIHGCIDLVNILLKAVKFDESKDRLISVGDLVDRGPESDKCLNLLLKPWFHAVMGNHEDLLRYSLIDQLQLNEEYSDDYETSEIRMGARDHILNGGEWIRDWKTYSRTYAEFWVPKLDQLPLILCVGKDTEFRYNVVHSEILHYTQYVNDDFLDNYSSQLTSENLIWGRNLFAQNPNNLGERQTKDLSITFSGHTIQKKIKKIGRQINIDTCAFYAGFISRENNGTHGITLVEPRNMVYTTVNGTSHKITTGTV